MHRQSLPCTSSRYTYFLNDYLLLKMSNIFILPLILGETKTLVLVTPAKRWINWENKNSFTVTWKQNQRNCQQKIHDKRSMLGVTFTVTLTCADCQHRSINPIPRWGFTFFYQMIFETMRTAVSTIFPVRG
jgi:hypothetical protein